MFWRRLVRALRATTIAGLLQIVDRDQIDLEATFSHLGDEDRRSWKYFFGYVTAGREGLAWDHTNTVSFRGGLVGVLEKLLRNSMSVVGRSKARSRTGDRDQQAVATVEMLENTDAPEYSPGWRPRDVAVVLGVHESAITGRHRDGAYRCPEFMRLWKRQKNKRPGVRSAWFGGPGSDGGADDA